jgi:hypothetical protein
MRKQPLIITVAALVLLAGVAYLAGSINTDKDGADASKSQNNLSTYIHSDIGFSFNYPKDYSIKEEKDNLPADNIINVYISRTNQTGDPVSVSVYRNIEKLDIEAFLLKQKNSGVILLDSLLTTGDFSGESKRAVTIDEQTGVQYQDETSSQRNLFLQNGDYVYVISEQSVFGSNSNYNLIIDSFNK